MWGWVSNMDEGCRYGNESKWADSGYIESSTNSTYWWIAYRLWEKEKSRIIKPINLFLKQLSEW